MGVGQEVEVVAGGKGAFSGGSSAVKIGNGWNSMTELTGVGDMNGDQIPDLIAVLSSTGDMYLYPGKTNGLGTRTKQGTG